MSTDLRPMVFASLFAALTAVGALIVIPIGPVPIVLQNLFVMLMGLLLGPRFINWLRKKQGKGQPIRADGPQSHLAKRGTPTMGGLLILISVFLNPLFDEHP